MKLFLILILGYLGSNNPSKHSPVDRIYFSKSGNKGGHQPVWNLTVNSDRTAIYEAIENNKQNGVFTATLSSKKYDHLIELLNKIEVDSLKEYYEYRVSCVAGRSLQIDYQGGKIIRTVSASYAGPKELKKFYKSLEKLRDHLVWK